MQQHQELWHDALHIVGDEDLVAVELDFVLLHLDALLGLREIEDAGQLERVFDVDVDVEQRLVEAVWVQFAVEFVVVLILELGGVLFPQRLGVVDDPWDLNLLFLLLAFGLLPFFLVAETYRHRQELAVFFQQVQDPDLIQELFCVIRDVQDDIRAALRLFPLFKREFGVAVALPVHCGSILIGFCEYLHTVRHHEGGIESEAEMADQLGRVSLLVFVQELAGSGKCYVVDVALHLVGGHADALVGDDEQLFLLIKTDFNGGVADLPLDLAHGGQCLEF